MSVQLQKQPTAVPTRKKLWQDTAQFGIVATAWLLGTYGGVDVPPGVEGLAVAVAGGWIGYAITERAS